MDTAIFKPADWFAPVRWPDVFNTAGPVEIDVGCGKGGFLLWAAQARPQSNFLGIERQLVRLRKVDGKIRRLGLANAKLVRIEAGYFISKVVPDGSVAAYHVYFPDPWPKRRHQAHRLFQPEFVTALWRTLQPRGVVNVATDDAAYDSDIRKVMGDQGRFGETIPETLPEEATTEFERVFRQAGQPIYRGRFVRRD